MNSLHTKSSGGMNSRHTNIYSICGLILIFSWLCTGCLGLSGANTKNNNSSSPTVPTISITAPAAGAAVSRTLLITTSASSNTTGVQFEVDGKNTGPAVTSAPFDSSLDTAKLSDGNHSLTAVASNAGGLTATSAAISIDVFNTVPLPPTVSPTLPTVSIISPVSGASVSGIISVTPNVSFNTTSVQLTVDGKNSGAAATSAPFSLSLNTATLSNGSHSLAAAASNAGGRTATSATVSIDVNNTAGTPPVVSITSPVSGASVSGTISVTTNVSANTTSVQFKVDGKNSGAAVTSAPFILSLNTTTLSSHSHTLAAIASNAGGQTATSAAVSIDVNNAVTTPPSVSITSPVSGANVSGTVTVSTTVSANTTKVQLQVDGKNSGSAVTTTPFSFSVNTNTLSKGSHSLAVVASNAGGQTATSAAVSVIVNTTVATPPTVSITSPASGANVSGAISVTTNASANTTKVQFKVDGNILGAAVTIAPFSFSLNTATISNGSHSLTAVASDTGGQTATSAAVSFTVNNSDKTPPVVSISSPAPGASVSGTVNLAANASDNVAVAKVEFYLDNSLQATDTSTPYTWSWNTASSTNGSHTVMAKAYDGAGNTASAAVTVSVSNGGSGGGGLTSSGPVTLSGQSGVTIQNQHITNPNGDCVTVTNSTNITIRQSEIGPCKGNGVVVSGGDTISVVDNYIHPEGALTGCCDATDGIFTNGTRNLTIQGNVIAYGEANIEANNQTNLKVIGNFLLNPRGGADSRGQNVQVWANNTTTLVQNNYTLASTDTTTYKFAEVQEDSINFGASPGGPLTTGVVAQNNYVTGGHGSSGCGIIADTGANSVQFLTNTIVNSGQCGIGIADGTNQVVDGNKILNTTPVNGGGNTGIYVWKVTSSDPACGPVQISNNVVSAIDSSGAANSVWNGGGCDPVTLTNNTFDAAALQALSPASQKLPPPPIPPQPANCVIASPFTNNTSVPHCGSSGSGTGNTPPTISISSPASGATVSGATTITAIVSTGASSVQFKVDGNNAGAAVTSAPFNLTLNTSTLSNGSHSITAMASNSAAQTATSAAIVLIVNNPHLSITTTGFPAGQVQVSYSATLQATGGTPPYAWSVLSGQIPANLSLSSSTGIISGVPTAAGSFSFTIQLKDGAGTSTSAAFSMSIATTPPPPLAAPFGHVFLVALENTNYTDVIGSSSMPYLNGLANRYGLATQYYADTHPSIGNYLMWTTGQILTNDDSRNALNFPVSANNAVRELIASGNTWKQYAESIPSVGYLGDDSTCCGGQYYAHHVPLPYMTDAQVPSQLPNIVPFTQFATDLANNALPNYAFITPNGCDDAHDCGLDVADAWLKTNIDPLIKSSQFQKDGLLVIAFDESGDDNTNGGGRVAAVIISPLGKAGYKSTTVYQHESVLRLMLEGLGVKTLPGAAATAPKMWEFFNFTPPS